MHVTLPDGAELELPEGASALDAARAIGPKLAQQAVLARVDGDVRDLRLPLPAGARLELLTTRDRHDPDALSVLRHSAAHLLAEAVRRLHPGVKVAIGPPIENGFYYDFEFPEPIREDDLAAIEAEVERELSEGRAWERVAVGRDEARARFEAEGETYKAELVDTADGEISLYTQGDFTDLCRGPHLQDSSPIKAFKLTGLAGAYWRGDEKNPQLTRIYGTAFFTKEDLEAHLERLERRARLGPPAARPAARSVPSPGRVARRSLLAPEGNGRLECARGPPPQREPPARIRRGQDAAHLRQGRLADLGPLGQVPGRDVPRRRRGRGAEGRSQADELPRAHAALRQPAAELPRSAAPICGVVHAASERARRHAPRPDFASSTSRRTTRTSSVRASRSRTRSTAASTMPRFLYDLFGMEARFELSTRPDSKLGTDDEWDFTESALQAALERQQIEYYVGEGEGAFYGPEDRPPHARRHSDAPWQMGTIQLDAQMPKQFGLTYMGEDNVEHTPYVVHRALLGSLERFMGILIEHYGGRSRSGSRPCRCASSRSPRRIGGRGRAARRARPGRRADRRGRAGRDARQADSRLELQKVPYVVVWGDRETREAMAVRRRGGQGVATMSLAGLVEEIAEQSPHTT